MSTLYLHVNVNMDYMPVAQYCDPYNERTIRSPLCFTAGFRKTIKLTLFKSRDEGTSPFRLPEGLVKWIFVIDKDFLKSTTPIVELDSEDIEVTETDTETSFELTVNDTWSATLIAELEARGIHEWSQVTGYIGELDGYTEDNHCYFCLQLEDIVFYNTPRRVADLPEE